jgi:hypothetical protein
MAEETTVDEPGKTTETKKLDVDDKNITLPKETWKGRLDQAKRAGAREYEANLVSEIGYTPDELKTDLPAFKKWKESEFERQQREQQEADDRAKKQGDIEHLQKGWSEKETRLKNEIEKAKADGEAKAKTWREQYVTERRETALFNALSKTDCPSEAYEDAIAAIERQRGIRVTVDDNNDVVVQKKDGDGDEWLPLTHENEIVNLESYVSDFIGKRSYFQAGSGTRGSGITSIKGGGDNIAELIKLASNPETATDEVRKSLQAALQGRK